MDLKRLFLNFFLFYKAYGFWEMGTTTLSPQEEEEIERPRQSQFMWPMTQFLFYEFWVPEWDWVDQKYRRRLCLVCGYSIQFTNLGVGVILNRRTTLTSANFLEPWKNVEYDIRIWALGRGGTYRTPYRYRVWRARRLIPRSNNPEHWHGPRGAHVPRHDLCVVHSLDQMYLYPYLSTRHHYAFRATLFDKYWKLPDTMFFAGSCYTDLKHIRENYKIEYTIVEKQQIRDCSKYLPKWWGKFICFRSPATRFIRVACNPSGGPLLDYNMYVMAIGSFEIRYNEERILVFTDLRYYMDHIHVFSNISIGEYYEYAYQIWGSAVGVLYENAQPFMPVWSLNSDLYPLGK